MGEIWWSEVKCPTDKTVMSVMRWGKPHFRVVCLTCGYWYLSLDSHGHIMDGSDGLEEK